MDKVEKDQIKKKRLDANEPLNVKLDKFKQHFHQAVEEIEAQPSPTLPRNSREFEMQLVQSQLFL